MQVTATAKTSSFTAPIMAVSHGQFSLSEEHAKLRNNSWFLAMQLPLQQRRKGQPMVTPMPRHIGVRWAKQESPIGVDGDEEACAPIHVRNLSNNGEPQGQSDLDCCEEDDSGDDTATERRLPTQTALNSNQRGGEEQRNSSSGASMHVNAPKLYRTTTRRTGTSHTIWDCVQEKPVERTDKIVAELRKRGKDPDGMEGAYSWLDDPRAAP